VAPLSPLPPVVWEGESQEKGKTHQSGCRQFNRTTKEVNSNKNNTDKDKGILREAVQLPDAKCAPKP